MTIKPTLETKTLQPKHMRDEDYRALNTFGNTLRAERRPEDPEVPLEDTIRNLQNIPPFVEVSFWAVYRGHDIVATANIATFNMEQNRHLAQVAIDVHPEVRRHGVARDLLGRIVAVARERERRLLIGSTDAKIPAGEAFAERLGAEAALTERISQLELTTLNRNLLRDWQTRAQERAANYALGFWVGPYPREEYGAIAALMRVMNTAPRDNLDMEDFEITEAHVEQMEASFKAQKNKRWTLYARHKESGALAGYTEMYYTPSNPEVLNQGATGVFPEHRGLGLGRWLKAAMLEHVLSEHPEATKVRTGNAFSNRAMLAINTELGFELYESHTTWQIAVDKAQAYLDGAKTSA